MSPPQPPPKVTAAYRPDAPGGAPSTSASEAAAEEKPEWKEWLPLVSVAFGALQVVAAFTF